MNAKLFSEAMSEVNDRYYDLNRKTKFRLAC